ncbi:MAG: sulfurtransferase TusA family protein [Eubacteriales bacterium]|nr:sulfurtransferase TusA family protein [Eubacteriales bacterium]
MIDARGYSCPMPVVMVQKEVKAHAPQTLEVLVDDPCAVENITRFANNNGYTASARPDGGDAFALTLERKA